MTLTQELKELWALITGTEETLVVTAAQRSLLAAALYEYAAHHKDEEP